MFTNPATTPFRHAQANLTRGLTQSVGILVASLVLALAFNSTRELPLKPKPKIPAELTGTEGADSTLAEGSTPGTTQSAKPSTSAAPPTRHAKDITADELTAMADDGITLLLDSRNPEDYAGGYIPGAVNFPFTQFEAYYPAVSARLLFPEQPIVCYCEGGDCSLSHELASELYSMGYTNVFVLVGGFEGWVEQGREVEIP
ncbi:MAG: rhodanese-like domain-containing protein [Verrucomicrobiota bacterium]|jgi:rhodanese-related sulfurtransferase|nr:rhodanese-like domain-containing protein [Verrucomicrobiota bacterium]MDD8046266.1 rhodanese-like domain-containing protein [Verrucomicrobiota bacterium]MDD8051607.1 rhodanese-like domain-containing protein [Verrucomicrobiota bacterium]MDI9383851.1 rhodanese-like domain-containing protein [Verrucomicrobiota bacterium]